MEFGIGSRYYAKGGGYHVSLVPKLLTLPLTTVAFQVRHAMW